MKSFVGKKLLSQLLDDGITHVESIRKVKSAPPTFMVCSSSGYRIYILTNIGHDCVFMSVTLAQYLKDYVKEETKCLSLLAIPS